MQATYQDNTDKEIAKKVSELKPEQWEELESLYNLVINHSGPFSRMGGGHYIEPSVIAMPFTIEEPIIADVRQFFLDKHLIVMFNWSRWNEGKAMFRVKEEDRFKDTSLEDVLKLITAVMRNDRFNDGAWADFFENGDAQRLLKRLLAFKPLTGK